MIIGGVPSLRFRGSISVPLKGSKRIPIKGSTIGFRV